MEQDRWNRTDIAPKWNRTGRIPYGTGEIASQMEQENRLYRHYPRWNKAEDWLERNSMW